MEAIEHLKKHDYALILLDLMMPRPDGFGVIEYLKDHSPAIKPVVLVISAYADQRFKEVDTEVVAGVIRKPFEVADLGSLVRLCVNGYEEQIPQLTNAVRDSAIKNFDRQQIERFDDSSNDKRES